MKNVLQMPESSPYLQRSLVLDNGHLLVQVLKRSLGSSRGRNAVGIRRKADILLSVQRLHCPGVSSKAKDTENCRYIELRIIQQLRPFFA